MVLVDLVFKLLGNKLNKQSEFFWISNYFKIYKFLNKFLALNLGTVGMWKLLGWMT